MNSPGAPRAIHQAGFTLAELLVALALFGLIAGAGVALLAMAVDSRAASGERLAGQAAMVRTRALLGADLGQAAPRRWRDGGGAAQPAFASEAASGMLLRLVRRGWVNEDGAARASLQRVEWRLAGERLERRAAPMLDGTEPGPPALMMDGVRAARLRFFANGGWAASWPAPGQALAPGALPEAVEIVLETPGGALRQLFLLPPGAQP
jgi:general secretion pathway protein J